MTNPTVDTYSSIDDESQHLAGPLVAALERAWAAIRTRHPDVPAAVVVLGAGSLGVSPGRVRLGHFAATRWRHGDDDLPEVFIGGEGLSGGPTGVLGTLLHEAAHGLGHAAAADADGRRAQRPRRRRLDERMCTAGRRRWPLIGGLILLPTMKVR